MSKSTIIVVKEMVPPALYNIFDDADAKLSNVAAEGSNVKTNTKDIKDFTDLDLYKFLSPLMICLKVTGLYHKRLDGANTCCSGYFLFSMIIVVLLSLNAIRSFTVYELGEDLDQVLFFKLQMTIYSIEVALHSLIMIRAWYSKHGLRNLFLQWQALSEGKMLYGRSEKIFMSQSILISLLYAGLNTLGTIYACFAVPELEELFVSTIWPGALQMESKIALKSFMSFYEFIRSAGTLFPSAIMCTLCFIISRQFCAVNKQLSVAVLNKDQSQGQIEQLRMQHQRLSNVIAILDEVFSYFIAIVYISHIPMFCIILYNLIHSTLHISGTLLNVFWLIFVVLHLSTISVMAAVVNDSAHSPLQSIFNFQVREISESQSLQVSLFLSCLTGTSIGLTAGKMFVINRPAILTIIGMLITYFVLMVQFRSTPSPCTCNCLTNLTSIM